MHRSSQKQSHTVTQCRYILSDQITTSSRINDAQAPGATTFPRAGPGPGHGAWAYSATHPSYSASRLKRHPATPTCAATLTCAAVLTCAATPSAIPPLLTCATTT